MLTLKHVLYYQNKKIFKLFSLFLNSRIWSIAHAALEITADHRSMIGENLAVIGRKSPLVIMMIGRKFFPSNLRASYFFPASFFISLPCLFRITLLHEAAIFNIL